MNEPDSSAHSGVKEYAARYPLIDPQGVLRELPYELTLATSVEERKGRLVKWLIYAGFSPTALKSFVANQADILLTAFDADSILDMSATEGQLRTLENVFGQQIVNSSLDWLLQIEGGRYSLNHVTDAILGQFRGATAFTGESWSSHFHQATPIDLTFVGHVNNAGFDEDEQKTRFELGDIYIQDIFELINNVCRKQVVTAAKNAIAYKVQSDGEFYHKVLKIFTNKQFLSSFTRKGGDEANLIFSVNLKQIGVELDELESNLLTQLFRVLGIKIVTELNEFLSSRGYKIPVVGISYEDFARQNPTLSKSHWYEKFSLITPKCKLENNFDTELAATISNLPVIELIEKEFLQSVLESEETKGDSAELKNYLTATYAWLDKKTLATVFKLTQVFVLLLRGRMVADKRIYEEILFILNNMSTVNSVESLKNYFEIVIAENSKKHVLPYLLGYETSDETLEIVLNQICRVDESKYNYLMRIKSEAGKSQFVEEVRLIGLFMYDNVTNSISCSSLQIATELDEHLALGWIIKARVKIANLDSQELGNEHLLIIDKFAKEALYAQSLTFGKQTSTFSDEELKIIATVTSQGRKGADNYIVVTAKQLQKVTEIYGNQRVQDAIEKLELRMKLFRNHIGSIKYNTFRIYKNNDSFTSAHEINTFPVVVNEFAVDQENHTYDYTATGIEAESLLVERWMQFLPSLLDRGDEEYRQVRSGLPRINPSSLVLLSEQMDSIRQKITVALDRYEIIEKQNMYPLDSYAWRHGMVQVFTLNNRGPKYLQQNAEVLRGKALIIAARGEQLASVIGAPSEIFDSVLHTEIWNIKTPPMPNISNPENPDINRVYNLEFFIGTKDLVFTKFITMIANQNSLDDSLFSSLKYFIVALKEIVRVYDEMAKQSDDLSRIVEDYLNMVAEIKLQDATKK